MRRSTTTNRVARLVGVLAATGLASIAMAQAQPAPEQVDAVLKKLNDPNFAERESASTQLNDGVLYPDTALINVLQRGDLSLEQRSRIVEALKRRFESSPRGAIGIQFGMGGGYPVVTVTYPTFPATERKLIQPGDIFIALDGQSVVPDDENDMARGDPLDRIRSVIFSHDPGDSVSAIILRPKPVANANGNGNGNANGNANANAAIQQLRANVVNGVFDLSKIEGDRISVDIPLGRLQEMAGAVPNVDAQTMARAWTLRANRLGITSVLKTLTLCDNITQDAWTPHARLRYIGPSPQAIFAGPARADAELGDGLRRQNFDFVVRQAVGNQRVIVQRQRGMNEFGAIPAPGQAQQVNIVAEDPNTGLGAASGEATAAEELFAKVARLERLRQSLADTEQRAADATEPAMRRALEDAATEMRRWVDELAEEVDRDLIRASTRRR